MSKKKEWFYRFTAAHFILTALTGMVLYFRPGHGRPGLYSEGVKDWIVMIHNGEWISFVLWERPFASGITMGLVLGAVLIQLSSRRLRSDVRRWRGALRSDLMPECSPVVAAADSRLQR